MSIQIKRAYDEVEENDGFRVLVDRLWPRGITKFELRIDLWLKDIAPSDHLRKWFGHDAQKWEEFKRRYFEELVEHEDLLVELINRAVEGMLTLVYAAKDERHNNAVALKEYLEQIST